MLPVLCILFLAACGTLEVGTECTPTPDHATPVAALTTEKARLTTQVATPTTPTPTLVPDLGKLAYVQEGDIWGKTLPKGEPQRLTGDGCNREPRWSPSGEWLAFRKDDDRVWVMRADGSVIYPLNEGAAVGAFTWAPKADRLAYIAGVGALMAVNADGSNQQELVTQGSGEPYTGVMGMTWSPDGEWLAYERVDVLQKERPAERYAGLWRIRADGSGATELLNAGTPATYEPILAGWSSDGSHILFWSDPQFSRSLLADGAPLLALPVEGGTPAQLAEDVLAYRDFVVPALPGTDQVAVIVGGYRGAWTNKVLHIFSASTGEDMALTSSKLATSSPAWSPDGARLAYVAMPDEGDLVGGEDARLGMMNRRIWVTNAQGELQPRQLADDPGYRDEWPLWSANGSHILFGRFDAEDRASLWLIPVAGGEPQQVVEELMPLPDPVSGWFGYYGHMEWDVLFDWWRGPVPEQAQPQSTPVPRPQETATPSPDWATYTSLAFGVTLQRPAGWQPVQGYYEERYQGLDGFFEVSAIGGLGRTLDEVCDLDAHQKLRPYGTQPDVQHIQIQGRDACLILHSEDQPADMKGQAALIVRYPQPVQIGGNVYHYFVLWADRDHIWEIAETLQFVVTSSPAASATPTNVYTWSSMSPDGRWVAEGMMEGPFLLGDDEQYRTQLKVMSTDGTLQWTVVDETLHYGLGYTVPSPFHWSQDGRFLYFTNELVPDGCALFVNGSDLHRVDLTNGRVTEIVPNGVWWLSLSPDETMLAYLRWSGERQELILRELARGEERRTQLDARYSQAGSIVWSPDRTALMLTLASNPCDPVNWTQSVVRVDLDTMLPTTLIGDDGRLFVTVEWLEAGRVLLRDKDGNSWWMDAVTGQVTRTD